MNFWGLMLFVGIPLPGTGAWTGALVASLLEVDIKKSSHGNSVRAIVLASDHYVYRILWSSRKPSAFIDRRQGISCLN